MYRSNKKLVKSIKQFKKKLARKDRLWTKFNEIKTETRSGFPDNEQIEEMKDGDEKES